MSEYPHTKKLDNLGSELDKLTEEARSLVLKLSEQRKEYAPKACLAEWHIRGLNYHYKRVFEYYRGFAAEVSSRASTGAGLILMYSPDFQIMLFEVYALVNLARITLDNLRDYLSPVFSTPYEQLPKSVNDFMKGTTDCPVYEWINNQDVFEYLIDFRNCLVHYRSFATSDNALAIEEGADVSDLIGEKEYVFAPMARAFFRKVGENGFSVNVYLPDTIFERTDGSKRLAKFTYEERWNLLSQCRAFAQDTSIAVLLALKTVLDTPERVFTYSRR